MLQPQAQKSVVILLCLRLAKYLRENDLDPEHPAAVYESGQHVREIVPLTQPACVLVDPEYGEKVYERTLEHVYPDVLKKNVPEELEYDMLRRFQAAGRGQCSL